jgi:hypothetical protein
MFVPWVKAMKPSPSLSARQGFVQYENHRFIRCIFWLELSIMSPELHAITVLKNTISNMIKANKSNAFVLSYTILFSSHLSSLWQGERISINAYDS